MSRSRCKIRKQGSNYKNLNDFKETLKKLLPDENMNLQKKICSLRVRFTSDINLSRLYSRAASSLLNAVVRSWVMAPSWTIYNERNPNFHLIILNISILNSTVLSITLLVILIYMNIGNLVINLQVLSIKLSIMIIINQSWTKRNLIEAWSTWT